MTDIVVGQKWRDLDKRMYGRTVTIVAIGSDQNGKTQWAWYERGKSRIRLRADRLRKPFFELVP